MTSINTPSSTPAGPTTPLQMSDVPGAPLLFTPLTLRDVTFRNRAWLPPMDQYSVIKQDGVPTDWHYQHYVSRALGGFGLVIAEATAVSAQGRISPHDTGLWNDEQQTAWTRIAHDIAAAGAIPGIQLNHAGRKGSSGDFRSGYEGASVPSEDGGWKTVAPSPIPFGGYAVPDELTREQIHAIVRDFEASARRALAAGFTVIELHAAHGYLMSQFLDPYTNHRSDEYGGDVAGRSRFLVEVVDAVRGVMPDSHPLFVRISATDWAHGGWNLEQTVEVSKTLKLHGVDLIDVSTGGILPYVTVPVKPLYQVSYAAAVREHAKVPVTAVGLITKPKQAEKILRKGNADAVEIGRAALRQPYWALHAAHKLGLKRRDISYPDPYVRGSYRDR